MSLTRPKYDKKDFLDQTDAVTTQEDLPANSGDAGFNDGGITNDNHSPDYLDRGQRGRPGNQREG
jgi:hypothetical protein